MSAVRSAFLGVTLLLALLVAAATASFAAVENCGNCVDDDNNGLVDRHDPGCTPPADGANQGIGDESRGKVLSACEKAAQKAGIKYVLGTMKQFQKCTQGAATCIQTKPGDAACQAKVAATCAKIIGGFDASAAKFAAAIVAKCGVDDPIADLKALDGLGFQAEQAPCQTEGGPASLNTVADVASCLSLQHFCRAQHLVAVATPRARELLTFAGRLPIEFPCIDQLAGADGGGAGVAPDHAKALLKCSKTIDKLALALVGSGGKVVQNCLNAGIACLQVKDSDAGCLAKARAKCGVGFAKLQDPQKGTVAKLAAKFQKACSTSATLSLSDLRNSNGLGLDAELNRCFALGTFNTAQCFGAQAFCEGAYVIEREVPRARELADLLQVVIPGFDD